MKSFCLPPKDVVAFKRALKEKDVDIVALMKMDSIARTDLLRKYAGDNASEVNLLFEQKLVLKNKIQGIKNWASKVGEIGRYSPEGKKAFDVKTSEYKELQRERIFNPKKEEAFLNDLADTKIGTHITREEAKTIFNLSTKSEELLQKFNHETGEWINKEDGLAYGAAKHLENKYLDKLKNEPMTIVEMIKGRTREVKNTWKENKANAVEDVIVDTLRETTNNSIALVATADNSFIGRQGFLTLITHPTAWFPAAKHSFIDIFNTIAKKSGAEKAVDAAMADYYSRPNYINGSYEIAKIGRKIEEEIPATLPERIPILGTRIIKAADLAFTNSAFRMRIDLYDLFAKVAKRNGRDVSERVFIEEIGKVVNSATARGSFGKYEHQSGLLKLVLWAPKMMKGNIDVLTAHRFGAGLKDPFARMQARRNLYKLVGETAALAAILNAISPGSVEVNPTATNFMRFTKGDTHIDLTAGKGSYITLAARAISVIGHFPVKSSSGKYFYLNEEGFKTRNFFDVGIDFLANKTHPVARATIDIFRGKNFEGKKPTIESTIYGAVTPITIQNFVQNFYGEDRDGSAEAVVGSVLDEFGINAQTYATKKPKRKLK